MLRFRRNAFRISVPGCREDDILPYIPSLYFRYFVTFNENIQNRYRNRMADQRSVFVRCQRLSMAVTVRSIMIIHSAAVRFPVTRVMK